MAINVCPAPPPKGGNVLDFHSGEGMQHQLLRSFLFAGDRGLFHGHIQFTMIHIRRILPDTGIFLPKKNR